MDIKPSKPYYYRMDNLHVKLRVWRKRKKLNQAQVAEMIGAGVRSVNRWESEGLPKNNQSLRNIIVELINNRL